MINLINTVLSWLTLSSHILLILFLIFLAIYPIKKVKKHTKKLVLHVRSNAIKYAFVVATSATLGSLFYSEIAGFTPCLLCWWQRIFMYVLPIILLVAIIYKDYKVRRYTIPLATIGALIAIYHIIVQLTPTFTCIGQGGIDCGLTYVLGFGYITIPIMSLTAFVMIIILSYIQK